MTKTHQLLSRWKVGDEYAPFHRQASHVRPDYRDGWNDCYEAASTAVRDAALEAAAQECDEFASCEGIAQRCAKAIRAMKGKT